MSADPAELRWRMVDELATNNYVIPHWQEFLSWRSAFLAVPRHALIPDTLVTAIRLRMALGGTLGTAIRLRMAAGVDLTTDEIMAMTRGG